jgi:DNA-binding GntR family transcriptional regulator
MQVAWVEARFLEMQRIEIDHPDNAAAAHADVSAQMSRFIFEAASNKLLAQLLSRMSLQIARYTVLGLSVPRRREQSRATWAKVVAAIRKRDARVAERLGRKLVSENLSFALSQIAGQ